MDDRPMERWLATDALKELASHLDSLAYRQRRDKLNSKRWYEEKLRRRGAAQAYSHAAKLLRKAAAQINSRGMFILPEDERES